MKPSSLPSCMSMRKSSKYHSLKIIIQKVMKIKLCTTVLETKVYVKNLCGHWPLLKRHKKVYIGQTTHLTHIFTTLT